MISRYQRYSIYALFTLSGFTSLVYEILWAKQLSLIFGTSMIAVSIVAATFMAGIALGSHLMGRFSDRHGDHLRIYAILEFGIAACALALPLGLDLIQNSYIDFSALWPDSPMYAHSIQFIQTVVLLLLPASLMGGTFPVICRQFARRKCGGQIGRLYAFNTIGATLGAFLCGYLLIPQLGISTSNYLSIALNIIVVIIAWQIGGRIQDVEPREIPTTTFKLDPFQRFILVSIASVGFLSLAYEILWTRVLLLFLGNTSYAFSLILSCFLVGIALGGWFYARMVKPDMHEKKLYLFFISAMAAFILMTLPFYDKLAYIFQSIHEISGQSWTLLTMFNWLTAFAIMGVPAIFSGILLPASVALLDPGKTHIGSGVGYVVCCNTLGAVFGSLVAGFIMVPAFGLQNSFLILGLLNLAIAAVLMFRFHEKGMKGKLSKGLLVAGIFAALVAPDWDPALMNCGVYCYAAKFTSMGGIDKTLEKERVIETIEGRDTTVAIHESLDGRFRFFTVNGKTDGGNGRDTSTQLLVGHLPLMLHPQPDNALVIGLGTGITLKGLSHYVSDKVDCVEISPEVVEAEKYFSEHNGYALDDPKVHLLINDGRNHLFARDRLYDVIISEPSNPWQSGNANLFTREFYQLVENRLSQGGVFSQWLGLYDITPENLKVASRTLMDVFPNVLVFHSGSDLIMLATRDRQSFNYNRIAALLEHRNLGNILREINITTPGDLLARHYLFSSESFRKFSHGETLNLDDRPILEYSAHHNLGDATLGKLQESNMRALMAARGQEMLPLSFENSQQSYMAAVLRDLGSAFKRAGSLPEAQFFMQRAEALEAEL